MIAHFFYIFLWMITTFGYKKNQINKLKHWDEANMFSSKVSSRPTLLPSSSSLLVPVPVLRPVLGYPDCLLVLNSRTGTGGSPEN
jgi:hypothetical protein